MVSSLWVKLIQQKPGESWRGYNLFSSQRLRLLYGSLAESLNIKREKERDLLQEKGILSWLIVSRVTASTKSWQSFCVLQG